MAEAFEAMLTGGHPNSLGRTVEVAETVLTDHSRLEELYSCYGSEDAVVRLRTSSALKRIEEAQHDWLLPYMDRLIGEIGLLDQASAQWTLADLFQRYENDLKPAQRAGALAIMKRNLAEHQDWIVLNLTIETLTGWSQDDTGLKDWMQPHLQRLSGEKRKSVAKRAQKAFTKLYG